MGAIRIVLTAISIALCCAPAAAQFTGVDLRPYQQSTLEVLRNARALFEPKLSPDRQRIAQSVVYRVSVSPGIGAFAAFEDGRRLVVIHAGTVQMMDWMFDAVWMSGKLGRRGCFEDFVTYLHQIIEDNNRRVASNLPLLPARAPRAYAAQSGNACSGVTAQDFQSTPEYGSARSGALDASIVAVYLHELAHHVLGHTTGKRSDDPAGLAMSRRQEEDADSFAVQLALQADYRVIVGYPWYAFVAAFGGNSIEAERKSTHPLGLRRLLDATRQTRDYYRANPQAWKTPATYQQFMAELDDEIRYFGSLLQRIP